VSSSLDVSPHARKDWDIMADLMKRKIVSDD